MDLEEGNSEVPLPLVDLVDGNAMLDQFQRVDHEGDLLQQVFLALVLASLLDIEVEVLLVFAGDDVPGFSLSEVVVVDGVDEKVLHVPAEGRKLHPQVHPGLSYPRYLVFLVLHHPQQGVGGFVDVV